VQKNNPTQKRENVKAVLAFREVQELLVMDKYWLSIQPDGRVLLFDRIVCAQLKAKTIIRDIIIPYIKLTYGIEIGLNYGSKDRNPKNTRDLGREIYKILSVRKANQIAVNEGSSMVAEVKT
jgi:hypothetical protein